jgi:hypothetical protein
MERREEGEWNLSDPGQDRGQDDYKKNSTSKIKTVKKRKMLCVLKLESF